VIRSIDYTQRKLITINVATVFPLITFAAAAVKFVPPKSKEDAIKKSDNLFDENKLRESCDILEELNVSKIGSSPFLHQLLIEILSSDSRIPL